MNTAAFHSRLAVLGLSVRRFAAITGVQYETARHWGVARKGHPQEFPRWVPLMLEMMDPSVSRKPPEKALLRPLPRLVAASHQPIQRQSTQIVSVVDTNRRPDHREHGTNNNLLTGRP
jgi:hypothetical protein